MKQLFALLLLLCAVGASGQNVIAKKGGSTVACRVVEGNSSEIVYKKWTDLNGSKILSRPKKLCLAGLIGGATKYAEEQNKLVMPGGIIMACGTLCGTTFCLMAHNCQRQISRLQISSVYQYEHKFTNGSSFTTGVDVLKDRMLNTQTIGVGLSYNF